MNEIISSILEAEKKADEMINQAQAEARALKLYSDKMAEEIKVKTVQEFKTLRVIELEKAEKTAEEKYNEIIKVGEEKANAIIIEAKDNLIKVADKIVEGIIR